MLNRRRAWTEDGKVKRALALTVSGLVVVVLLAVLGIAEALRPSAWEEELEAYKASRRLSGEEIVLLSLVRARHPERFAPALSLATYGNEVYSDREVPYPPQRLYCLRIERSGAGARRSRQVLFLALHRPVLCRLDRARG